MLKILGKISCLMLAFSIYNPAQAQIMDDVSSQIDYPRYMSLRSDNINGRSGPHTRYPIEWVYSQKGAPIEVLAEFEDWRKVKDWQGSVVWMHKNMISSKRMVKVITPGENNLYKKPNHKSDVIARVEDEVVGEIIKCPAEHGFCQIKFEGISGWISKNNLFGIYKEEVID